MNKKVEGGCLCGAVRYEVQVPVEMIVTCHCINCQKASGAGATANSPVPSDAFSLTRGEPKIYKDTAESGNTLHRAFCGDCGSPIYSMRENMPERKMLKTGTLDDSSGARVVMNIWTGSARAWSHIDAELPAHEKNRPA